MNPKQALEKAIGLAKGQTALAKKVDPDGVVKQAHVWNWLNRDGRVAPDRVLDVSRAVGFEVTPHELRPDLYPNESDGLPPELQKQAI